MIGNLYSALHFQSARGAILCLLLAAALSACRKQEAQPRVELVQSQMGFAGAIDPDQWNSLRLSFINPGMNFQGILEVEGFTDSIRNTVEPIIYRTDLEIPGQGTAVKEVTLPIRPDGWEAARVTLRQPGYRKRFRLEIPLPDTSRLRLLVIGESFPNLSELMVYLHDNLKNQGMGDPTRIHRSNPENLPVSAPAYNPFQLILLWGDALGEAPAGALEALAGWVARGGTLVAFPGERWAAGIPQPFLDLAGLVPGDPDSKPGRGLAEKMGPLASTGFYRELHPAPGAVVLQGGVAIRSNHGAGSVTTFSFRPGGNRVPGPEDAPAIYNALKPAVARALSFAGDSGAGLRGFERAVANDLFSLSGFHVPPVGYVVLCLAVYLLVGFFLPFIILKRIGRREWIFLVVILAAGLSTLGIYRWGLLSGLKEPELEEVTILRIHGDGRTAEATTFLGLVSPSLKNVELAPGESPEELPLVTALPQPLRGERQRGFYDSQPISIPRTTLTMEPEQHIRISPLTLPPNGMRYLRYDYRAPVDHLIELMGKRERNGNCQLRDLGFHGLKTCQFDGQPRHQGNTFHDLERLYLKDMHLGNMNPFERSLLGKTLAAMAQPREHLQINRWTARQSGSEEKPLGEFHRMQPGYLVGLARTPFFPGCREISRRKSILIVIVELEPEDTEW